jgi:hypothetical protein
MTLKEAIQVCDEYADKMWESLQKLNETYQYKDENGIQVDQRGGWPGIPQEVHHELQAMCLLRMLARRES